MRNLSYENEFDFHENIPVGGTQFHMNGLARRLVLTQRRKTPRKCPIKAAIYLVCPRAKLQYTLLSIKWKILHIYRASAGKGSRTKPATSPGARQNHRSLVLISTTTKFAISTASGNKNIKNDGSFSRWKT